LVAAAGSEAAAEPGHHKGHRNVLQRTHVAPYKPVIQHKTLAIKSRPPAGRPVSSEGRLCNHLEQFAAN
jgi:hypothetical protein